METVVANCEICNKPFVQYRPYQKYCSNICRQIATEKAWKYKYKKNSEMKKHCIHCGTEFTTNDNKKRYCSHECYEAHQTMYHRKAEKRLCNCLVCGTEFETTHATKRYCSAECYQTAKKEREQFNVRKLEEQQNNIA